MSTPVSTTTILRDFCLVFLLTTQTAYLKSHFPEGDALIFGPRSCDHHYVFVADYRKGAQELVPERPYAGHVLEARSPS